MADEVFVVMQIGDKGSAERRRADEVYELVLVPVLNELGLTPYRSDLDPTPGTITPQLLKKLLEARLVIADLTGRNPNVFYELGIAHTPSSDRSYHLQRQPKTCPSTRLTNV